MSRPGYLLRDAALGYASRCTTPSPTSTAPKSWATAT